MQLSSALTVTFPERRGWLPRRSSTACAGSRIRRICTRSSSGGTARAPPLSRSRRGARRRRRRCRGPNGAFIFTCRSSPPSTTASARRRTTCARCSASRARTRFTRHFEIETYTWDVLPAGLKIDLLDSIGREYEWVLTSGSGNRLAGSGKSGQLELEAGSWKLYRMHKTVVLNVVGLTPALLGPSMPALSGWAREARRGAHHVGVSGRDVHRAVRLPHRPLPRHATASSATAGMRARTPRSGSGNSRTGSCRRRRSGTRRAPPIRRSRARTCSGGSTCTRRRTTRSRRVRCTRPTAERSRTSTRRRPGCATSSRLRSARFRSSSSGDRERRSDRRSGSRMPPSTSIGRFNPTLTLVYLPHLDYNLQRVGPAIRRRRRTSARWTTSAAI